MNGEGSAPVDSFAYDSAPRRVRFGPGALERLGDEIPGTRVLLVTSRGRLEAAPAIVSHLGASLAGVFDGVGAQVPVEVVRAAVDELGRVNADVCVAFGGGSAIGVAKGVALETGVPVAAVPTTFSGSEMTAVWGLLEEGEKRTGRDPRVRPRVVVYDPLLTDSLPPQVAAESGMNAIAHCVEALYAADRNPVASLLAAEGIALLADALSAMPEPGAASRALLGAHLAGAALDQTSMALHHKLCHVVAGGFGLRHAGVHARLLPWTAAFNAEAAPDAMRAVQRALGRGGRSAPRAPDAGGRSAPRTPGAGEPSAPRALFDLNVRLGIAGGLRALGLTRDDLERAADRALERSYPNPAPVTREGVRRLLEAAWEGVPPP